MARYTAQRLLAGLLTAFIASLLIFAFLRATIDPLEFYMSTHCCVFTEEGLRKIKEDFGLHGPLHMQYLRWMGGWVTGNWGESVFYSEDTWKEFTAKLPATLQLVFIAQAIAVLVGIPAGIMMALKRRSWIDNLGRSVTSISLALPVFLTATLLLVAGLRFYDWSPKVGYIPPLEDPMGNLIMFIWPALVLGIPVSAAIALMTRSSTLDALRQDHVQAISVPEPGSSASVFLYTLRYTLVPAAVILGLTFPAILGGALIMEQVFVLDGAGHMLVEALNRWDFPMIESLALFFAVWVIAVNTMADILCGWLDPNTRSTRKPPREEWNHLANPVRLL